MITLRPYQETAVEALRAAYRAGRRAPLLQLATSTGKTAVFCHIALSAVQRGKRVCILVHRQELLFQTSRMLKTLGVEHGLIAPGRLQSRDLVQVASVQTLVRRIADPKKRMGEIDLIVIDECHHAVAGAWGKVLAAWPKAKILSVTATPCRLDGKGLATVFDDLIQGPPVAEMIRLGYLVQPVVYAPPVALDLTDVRSRGGDYVSEDLAAAMDRPAITGDAVTHYERLCPNVPAIVFCASIDHARHVADEFARAGWRAAGIDGSMADGQRRGLIQALGNGGLHILTSCNIISEGTDIPIVGAAILLRPTKSVALYLQQVGRALRPAPGKDKAIILDHVGNVLRHGLPDEEWAWFLDAGAKKTAKEIELRQCPSCYAAHRPARMCPECGHVYANDTEQREIAHEAGDLRQITPEMMAERRAKA
ncbi:MAG: DEAD/DEAH box helicase-like protein [Rhodospirillaceae bacterium]|nr:MAG: DEAD/DEAH box helicase-like protein [Rhodospirillaceae bacterium]